MAGLIQTTKASAYGSTASMPVIALTDRANEVCELISALCLALEGARVDGGLAALGNVVSQKAEDLRIAIAARVEGEGCLRGAIS